MPDSHAAAAVDPHNHAGQGSVRRLRRWRRRWWRHDDPDGADAGDDESENGQAPLRRDDADHGPMMSRMMENGAAGLAECSAAEPPAVSAVEILTACSAAPVAAS